jgi:outer membrane protein OmpA-like peptidoglycan-associated protein
VANIKQQNVRQVTLIGHADSNGDLRYNDEISKQRALEVKKYLQQFGVTAKINVIGKGEREPLQLANPSFYTNSEIDTLNRRVELISRNIF